MNKTMSAGVGHDSGSEKSTTHSGINTANIIITNSENQHQAIEGVKTDITTETAAENSGRLENNFDKDNVFKELNLQVAVTKDFKTNANRQISEYIDDRQAAAREELQSAMKEGNESKRKEALDEIYKLQYQRRYLQLLVGVVAGSPEAAVTQQTLAIAATKMREETVKNSFLSPVVVDADGVSLSNVSARSENIYDGLKMGGARMDLDAVCGDKNDRCETQKDLQGKPILNARGYPKLKLNQWITFIGDSKYPSFQKLLDTDEMFAKISGATGGNQGSEGTLFGILYKQRPENVWDYYADTVIESFTGTHDFIGGQLPGFYDEYGNATRGRTTTDSAIVEAWSVAAIPLAAPFAASELISPELLEFIFSVER